MYQHEKLYEDLFEEYILFSEYNTNHHSFTKTTEKYSYQQL